MNDLRSLNHSAGPRVLGLHAGLALRRGVFYQPAPICQRLPPLTRGNYQRKRPVLLACQAGKVTATFKAVFGPIHSTCIAPCGMPPLGQQKSLSQLIAVQGFKKLGNKDTNTPRIPREIRGSRSKAAQDQAHFPAIPPQLTPTWRPWWRRGPTCPRPSGRLSWRWSRQPCRE